MSATKYIIPKNDQYKFRNGDLYFKLSLPSEAKLAVFSSKSGHEEYTSLTLRDLQLNSDNLLCQDLLHLIAIARYILHLDVPDAPSHEDLEQGDEEEDEEDDEDDEDDEDEMDKYKLPLIHQILQYMEYE